MMRDFYGLSLSLFCLLLCSPAAFAVEETGSLEGITLLDSEKVPEPEKRTNDIDTKTCGHELVDESLIATKLEGGKIALQNVVIELDIGRKGTRYEEKKEFEVDQKGCVYKPHIIVVKRNSNLTLKNSDDVAHNVHLHAKKNPSPNFNQLPGSESKYKPRIAEKIKVTCDVHPWMSSYIVVVDNPNYVKVSDEKGGFRIDDIPVGKYKVTFWHEKLGEIEKEVEIKPNETAKIEVSFKVNSGS